MNLSKPFILRPIATTLLGVAVAMAGVIAFNLLPVAPLPQIDFPAISVQASLPGASAQTMATSVATPLESFLGRIAGVNQMTSSSTLGQTRISLQFDLSRDIDGAARDVQAAINASASQLPSNLPTNPTYRKVNPSDSPIMIIALTSDIYTKGQLYDSASTILEQKLSQVDGIGQVIVGGSSLPAVRVELNPTALNKYGIGLTDVSAAIAAANTNIAKGQLQSDGVTSSIQTNDQIFKAVQYSPLIVAYQNGNPVRIKDVSEEVVDSVQDLRNAGLANGKPAVLIILFKQPGANVIATIENVRQMLPQLATSIPKNIDMTVMMDRSATINASLHDVEATLVISMILVILVTLIFLGSFHTMLIPAVAVPLSLLGTFAVMEVLGFSLDNLSLLALTIATGFVVDDAVVVLENISRHMEMGKAPVRAALDGTNEVGFTVLSMSLSLIAVFIPILMMTGIVGRLFREFSITLAAAILVSLVVSLTVTPMMCSRMLKQKDFEKEKHGGDFLDRIGIREHYAKSLAWALKYPWLMISLTIGAILLNLFLFYIIPKGFFPQQDTGRIMGSILTDENMSFQSMSQKLTQYVSIVRSDPGVLNVVGFVGVGSVTSGSLFVTLKDLSVRKVSADAIINRLRKKLTVVSGASLYLQASQDLVIGARQGNAQFQYSITADNLDLLNEWAPKLVTQLSKVPGIADVNSDVRDNGLQLFVNVDHDTALRLGLTSKQIDATLYAAFGQSLVSTMYTAMNQYYVVMEVAPKYWQNPDILNQIYINTPSGGEVPLSAISSFQPSSTLLSVNHQGQAPSATLSFNLLGNAALGDVVNEVGNAVAKMNMPSSINGAFQGTAQAFQASLSNEGFLIAAALLAVYIVLGILYESLIHPITILSTLPSAGVGALLALLISREDLSIIALIGIILLIGIVKKNAIMMIDFALHVERSEETDPAEAIYKAAVMRFRPIMMTTMAAMFGALPLVIGFGLGSELRQPLGIAIVGGLIVSQMMTLFTTPAIYLLMDRFGNRWKRTFNFLLPLPYRKDIAKRPSP